VKIARTCFMLDFWDKTNVFVKSVLIICNGWKPDGVMPHGGRRPTCHKLIFSKKKTMTISKVQIYNTKYLKYFILAILFSNYFFN
jgi:hypothetical protein